ncbi:spore coat protein [Salipaludibacillus keqinensis]|uniref:Spore coat protein n=1 Tax=Salipaludibacillus keqinensis TaxID=2045207 RepID=A0A323TKT5_9BACI|nr:CotD family spore coat protein [Salipaludibacillus keqinensis]PYZ95220.1 spore coat protein [Salipaludibacillus keqinensis]
MFGHRSCKRPQVLNTQFCPTQQSVREFNCDYIVPVVHPRHTTNVVNHRYNFQHSFPQTESTVNRIFNTQSMAGPGGPGQVAGAATGPGGFGGPGQVGGVGTGPWGQGPGWGHKKSCW